MKPSWSAEAAEPSRIPAVTSARQGLVRGRASGPAESVLVAAAAAAAAATAERKSGGSTGGSDAPSEKPVPGPEARAGRSPGKRENVSDALPAHASARQERRQAHGAAGPGCLHVMFGRRTLSMFSKKCSRCPGRATSCCSSRTGIRTR